MNSQVIRPAGVVYPRPRPRPRPRQLQIRWWLLAAVLVGALIGLTIRFDTQSLADKAGWWSQLLDHTPALLRIGLAFVAAFILLAAPGLTAGARELQTAAGRHRWWPWMLAHLLAFGAFYLVTARVFEGQAGADATPYLWFACWIALGMATLGLWLCALAPADFWAGFVRRERLPLLVAALAGTAAWAGGELARQFWEPLAQGTFWVTFHLLDLFYPDATYELSEYVLGTSAFKVAIAPECSGYEGIGLVTVFLAVYLWLFRTRMRFPRALVLFPIGALAIWLANAVRITALIAVGTSFSPGVALGGFHSQAGWIAFIAIALGIIVLTHRFRVFGALKQTSAVVTERHDAETTSDAAATATAMLVPLLVLMGAIMLTSAFTDGMDRLYPLRVAATVAALWYFRALYRRWNWSWSWHSMVIGGAVFVLWMALEPEAAGIAPSLGAELSRMPEVWAGAWLVFRVIGSVLVVPLVEELAFRGYLIRKLVAWDFERVRPGQFTWLSFVLSSVAFGLLHGRWLAGTLAGMAYALALYRRGSLGDAFVAHMTTNALIAAAVLGYGHWSLWQ